MNISNFKWRGEVRLWFFSHAALGYLTTIVLVKREERTRTVMMMGAFFGMLPDSDVILQL